ncbi:reverse transcriptase RNA-dependent DNA polymerase [Nitzschia inconspicua]|uniref:Reverse transcriptase RNA-dependent DNA polymerase n=1 Tax=Nitzschia inconspicua TaxID=303405 RepID=A0A9K3KBU9_9STRA|nr:reverse transcriptase RNA-dependent DNA polymerase [Nitzschia inconspicua]
MPRRQEWHPNRFQHAMMTTVTPFNDGGDDTDGDLPPLSTPTPSIRHNDKGGETTTPILATTITQDHFSDSESLPQFTSVEHANYPEFPPNKRTEELEDERRQALKDLKEWDGIIMTPEMEWVQHYIELAHLEAQAQHYGNPYFQFNHLMDTISPMFTLKGEEFLKRHFDMKESNIQTIARHIYPTDVVLYSVQLQQAGTNKEHRPFYSTIHNKIDRIIASTKVAKQLTDPNTSEHDVDNILDSARLLRCNTSYSTKSKQQNSRRHHKKNKRKRSSRRKTYHRDSDSNSSSDYSLSESSYLGEDSEYAYDSDENKTTTMSFSSNHKRQSAQSKEIGKVLKSLYDGAKQYHLSEYSVTRGTVNKRKSYFRTWIDTLRQILCSEPQYSHLLAKYPVIDCSNISTTSNIALAQFMFAKIEAGSRHHLDGVAIIRYLQRNFGGTTIIDCTKALQRLKDTCWEHQDNIDTFSNKFLRRSETYRTTLQSSKTKSTLDDVELLTIYLENLTVTMPQSHPLHQNVQNKFVELESCIAAEIEPTFTVHQMIDQMRYLESIQLNNTTSTRTSYNRARSRQQPRTPHTKANVASESQRNTNRANLVTQSKKFRPVKCWGCGHSHNLRDCLTTTDDQKQAIYRQKREEKQQRSNGQPTNPNNHQANKAAASKQEESTTTTTPPTTNISANKVIEMPRRRGTNFAAPAKHFSGMTTTIPPERTLNVKAFRTLTCATIEELITLLNDWLLDSGCTAHMSNNRDDFIGKLEPYVTMVEVANGSLIEVRWRGTVKLLLIDKFDPDNRATVYLKNVLYVPQLSRRLFSVSEWYQCGGQITFMPDRCRIEILDSDDIPIHTIDTDPIYAAEKINEERLLTVTQPEPARRKNSVEQHLLHQRLGHRAISTLLLAEEDDVWADVRMIPDQEKFCQTCKITTARTTNRGSSPLEQLDELVPGMCVMVDIVKNPVTDNVFAALQEWATSYGPSAEFNLSMLSRIHGDYDSAFRSEELRAKVAQYFIKVSFAAPRHQEQNGIHEANWQHIRNLAFAMMNQASVPKKFFHFAFKRAWKVHAVLPHKALTRAAGKVQTPLGVYEGKPVGIESFCVLFCPVVMTYHNINLRSKNAHGQKVIMSYNRKNNPQRGIRGIHVGLPRHNTGYLVYVPQMNTVLHCNDVYFDENFESTLAYTPSRHPAHFDIVVTDAPPHNNDNVEQTGSPLWFCNKKSSPYGNPMQTFAKAIVHEDYDIDVHAPHDEFDDNASVESHDDMPVLIARYEDDSDSDDKEEELTVNTQQLSYPESINIHDQPTDAATSPQHRYPQRIRRGNPKYACHTEQYTQHHTVPTPEEFVETVERAYNNEVVQPIQEVTDMLPTMFLPAPDNWKQILKLPPHVMSHWSASLLKELKELIKKQTFVIDTPNSGDPIIPVTAKFRVKLTKDGMIEKLKSRIALRGDLMRDNVEIPDTWCPIAGFRAFKMFLAMAAHYKKRIYQLDYVAAFLQADVLGQKFTTLPIEWKEMFRSIPEVHQWLDWFERETDRRFDVQKLGQAEWYLQSRITQLADYSIILDQSRYAALVAARYLGPVNEEQIPTSTRVKYASPLPSGTVFTKEDCSKTYVDVLKLQEEFGFEYAAAVGSLIYLMNTFIKLTFSIRKLAKFMQKPGRTHFTILKHQLHHVQCH